MAILTSISRNMRSEISPLRPQFNDGRWIETYLSLEFSTMGQSMLLTPKRLATMTKHDFILFKDGIRDFIQRVQERPEDTDPLLPFEPFIFTPLELDFEFSCLEGESDGHGNGEVAIRFMLNLKQIGHSSTSEHVGFTTEVEIKELLQFVNGLDIELDSCLANYSLNGKESTYGQVAKGHESSEPPKGIIWSRELDSPTLHTRYERVATPLQ